MGHSFKKYFSYFSKPQIFAVDVNNSDLKIFQIQRKGKKGITCGWSKKFLPQGVVVDFEVQKTDEFVAILKEALDEAFGKKIKGKSVIVSVPEDKVFLRLIKLPLMKKEEVKEAILCELESNIPISIDEVYFDWQIVAEEAKTMDILVAATPKRVVDSIITSFELAGLSVTVLEADSIATERSVLGPNEKDAVLVADIGIDGTAYFVYREGYPVFSSSSSISGKLFTDIVSKEFGMETKKAEHYKTKIGLGSNKQEREEALKIFKPILANLIQEINRTADFYDENLAINNKKIEKVILVGGGSSLKGLVSYVALHIKKEVVQGDPWKNVQFEKQIPPISKEKAQSYITAIGLALRASEDEYFD
jgi:type IV pilus assembly protein PilM